MRNTTAVRPAVLAGLVLLALVALWWAFRPASSIRGTPVPPVPVGGRPDPILVDDLETGQTQGIFGER